MRARDIDVLVLIGSPHEGGASERFGDALGDALSAYGITPTMWQLSAYPVAACCGCGSCAATGECRIAGDPWPVLARHMQSADLLFLVTPVYFAGPPAHLKAVLDRCQMFWARKYVRADQMPPERPCELVVLGEGGDPFGTQALETICTSALNCANLRIDGHVTRLVGKERPQDTAAAVADAGLSRTGWRDAGDAS